MNRILEFLRARRTFLVYCVIGLSGVGCDFLVYSLLLRSGVASYQQANAVGYLAGTVLSFILNARYNFRVTDRLAVRFLLFAGVAFLGYTVSAAALHGLVEWAGLDRYLAKAATLVAVVLIQYNLNRLLSFRTAT